MLAYIFFCRERERETCIMTSLSPSLPCGCALLMLLSRQAFLEGAQHALTSTVVKFLSCIGKYKWQAESVSQAENIPAAQELTHFMCSYTTFQSGGVSAEITQSEQMTEEVKAMFDDFRAHLEWGSLKKWCEDVALSLQKKVSEDVKAKLQTATEALRAVALGGSAGASWKASVVGKPLDQVRKAAKPTMKREKARDINLKFKALNEDSICTAQTVS